MRIVITTTLNDNLFHAKLLPLLRARPDVELVVVTDRQGPAYDRVRWVWPTGLWRIFGRLGGRLLLLLREVFDSRTQLVMAYNVVPHGMFASSVARLRSLPVYVHLIGGRGEIDFVRDKLASDNRVVAKSKNPQKLQDRARRVTTNADRVFVPGGNTERFLREIGCDPKRIVRLHSTIDSEKFFDTAAGRDIDVVVSAQLRERKRPLFTLEVFRATLDKRPGTKFYWLGDGPLSAAFANRRSELDLTDAVEWIGDADVAPMYRRSKLFLLCSVSEGLSLACMEAMACGVVPITNDCGDMSDVVGPLGAGVLLPQTATPTEFANEIIRMLDESERLVKESTRAKEIISSEHSFDSAERAWRTLLDELSPLPQ